MSQPVGIISKIKISDAGFKKFMRKEAVALGKEVFTSFWHKSANVYVLNYTKRTSTMYCFVYFNHGNAETLTASSFYQSLLRIEPFLDDDSEGYFLASLDSANISDFITENTIIDKKMVAHSFSEKDLKLINKEAQKNFFKKIEDVTDYSSIALQKPHLLNKSIRRHFSKFQDAARLKTMKDDLPQATPFQPMQLFKNYFYNGHSFYYCDGHEKITVFQNINLQLLEEKSYGLQDDKHIIIREKCIEENPKTFRMMHRAYTTYYKSATKVYDEDLEPIDEADPKSFKLMDSYFASDINYLYLGKFKISIADLGEFYYFDEAVFFSDKMIIGTKQIWLSKDLLETIDAPTFQLFDFEPNKKFEVIKKRLDSISNRHNYFYRICETIKYGKDKHGDLFIFKSNIPKECYKDITLKKDVEAIVLRKTYSEFIEWFEILADETISYIESITSESFDSFFDKQKKENSFNHFNKWINEYFDSHYQEIKHDSNFLIKVNNYLYNCWQEFEKSGKGIFKKRDTAYLEKGLAFYETIKQDSIAELNPHIFHHLCCFCVALNRLDEAVNYFKSAFYYGYTEFELMTTDKDLAPILNDPKVKEIIDWFKQNVKHPKTSRNWRWQANPNPFPRINNLMIDLLEKLPEDLNNDNSIGTDYVTTIMNNCFIWDISAETDEESLDYNKMIMKFQPYFNRYLQQNIKLSWQKDCAYHCYADYQMTSAFSHFTRLEYIFYQAHDEYGSKTDFNATEIENLVQKIKAKLDTATEEEIEIMKKSKVLELLEISLW